jgi:hypothetical protein
VSVLPLPPPPPTAPLPFLGPRFQGRRHHRRARRLHRPLTPPAFNLFDPLILKA